MGNPCDRFVNTQVDAELLKRYKIYCLERNTTPQKEFRKMIKETLENSANENK